MIRNMERVARAALIIRQKPSRVQNPINEFNALLKQSLNETGDRLRKGTLLDLLSDDQYSRLRNDVGSLGGQWEAVYRSKRSALALVTSDEELLNTFVRIEATMHPDGPKLDPRFVGAVIKTLEACDALAGKDEQLINPARQLAMIERERASRCEDLPFEEAHLLLCERMCQDVWRFRYTMPLDELKCALLLEDDIGERYVDVLLHQVALAS